TRRELAANTAAQPQSPRPSLPDRAPPNECCLNQAEHSGLSFLNRAHSGSFEPLAPSLIIRRPMPISLCRREFRAAQARRLVAPASRKCFPKNSCQVSLNGRNSAMFFKQPVQSGTKRRQIILPCQDPAPDRKFGIPPCNLLFEINAHAR